MSQTERRHDERNIVFDQFYNQVKKQPDAPAVVEGEKTYSCSQLLERSMKIAALLPEGVKRVGVVMDHGFDMIASLLAILYKGAAYIPAEPDFPIERTAFMMASSGCTVILSDQKNRSFTVPVLHPNQADHLTPCDPDNCQAAPDSLAYILFTSGSTGKPKGVMVTNHNICHYVRAFRHEFDPKPGDRMLQFSVCSFDIFTEEVYTTLLSGACLLIPPAQIKEDLNRLMAWADTNHVTEISGFPYLLQQLNETPDILPNSLRLLISGGDVLRQNYVDHIPQRIKVYNTYGPSETTVCASYYDCTGKEALPDGTFAIGKPVLETQIELLDENMNPVPEGAIGEICIFGEGISDGYSDPSNPENAAFTYTKDHLRVYRSGDLGRWLPDGNLAFLNRKDRQIMIFGKRVEPDEVESILEECPGVFQCAVQAYMDEQNLSYMTAYVVLDNQDLKLSTIRSFLARTLIPFMIPEFFVQLDEMPLNDHGKIERKKLPRVMKTGSLT